ncbi:histidine phosphatase family protein [Candidatus Daviesbacteria bacterium]|nr:histidine phosphatase family protein [Candidatus Daviesbacteria bacterium]
MKIYCVRHGLTELNKQKKVNGEVDEPLAPEGIKQVKTALSGMPAGIKHIYTSPMQRARETAEILNSKLKCSISSVDELTEIRMGTLAGKAWTEMKEGTDLKRKHRTVQFDYRSHGGESAKDVRKRLVAFLKRINKKHNDYETLIITHGGIIRILHLLEHGKPLVDDIEHISLHTFDLDKILPNTNSML